MSDRAPVPSSYKKLVSDITALYEGARRALVEAYWEIGKRIVRVEQKGEIKAAYGTGLLPKLSEELSQKLGSGFSVSNLRRMRQFYLRFPKQPPAGELTWAQHAELLPVENTDRRKQLIRKAVEKELDCKALRKLVHAEVAQNLAARDTVHGPRKAERGPGDVARGPNLLTPVRGVFYTFRIKGANETAWPVKNALLFDHGFKSYRALTAEENRGLAAGDIVEWTGEGLRKTDRAARDLFTYRAYVEKVIDGDTFWAVLDTGMRAFSRQKLRLRGIDCPEMDTPEGKAAKKFTGSLLPEGSEVTVLTRKNDKYDRYEADVWVKGAEGKEHYLNNLLLEKNLAVAVHF